MDTAPLDCQGSCFPVDCMPTDKIQLSMFYSAAQRKMYYPGQTIVVVCLFFFFFFLREKKVFIFKPRSLSIICSWYSAPCFLVTTSQSWHFSYHTMQERKQQWSESCVFNQNGKRNTHSSILHNVMRHGSDLIVTSMSNMLRCSRDNTPKLCR